MASNQVGNDDLTNHQNRLAALEKAIEINRAAIRKDVEGLRKQKQVSLRQNIAQIEQDLAVTRSLEGTLRDDHKEISNQLEAQNRSSIDVEMLSLEVLRSEEILNQVVRKHDYLRFDLEDVAGHNCITFGT